jgi:hypothetical protein
MLDRVDCSRISTSICNAFAASSSHPESVSNNADSGLTGPSDNEFKTTLLEQLTSPKPIPDFLAIDPGQFPNVTAEETRKIEEVARDLESIITYTLLKQMWASIPDGGLFGKSLADKFYREMWLEEIAKLSSKTGPGLGIAHAVQLEMLSREQRTLTRDELEALETDKTPAMLPFSI